MGRGGYRENGGRKPLPEDERRVTVTARVLPETYDKIKMMKEEEGFKLGQAIDRMMKRRRGSR